QFGATLSHLSFSMGEDAQGFHGSLEYTADLFEPATIERLLGHLRNLLAAGVARPTERLSALPLLGEDERRHLLVEWSGRGAQRRPQVDPIREMWTRLSGAPEAVALESEGRMFTAGDVAAWVGGLAGGLRADGVGPGSVVGIAFAPSPERALCMLAVLETGAAYALLGRGDEVEGMARVLAPTSRRESFRGAPVSCPDFDGGPEALPVGAAAGPETLVCLGSSATGARALLSRRNAARVFAALDEAVPATPGGAWLAVGEGAETLAGLDLLWALSRGLRVVFPPEAPVARLHALGASSSRRLDFSLSYFANDEDQVSGAKYRLLLDGARFADRNGFTAIWTPERHFHAFGGLYPSPAVVSAGLATATERVRIRAGSVVLPLHDPIVVAEQWAVVDNLSGGRVDVSFASGWHANDFALAPDVYSRRKQVMLERIQLVRGLWRGEPVRRRDGNGAEVEIRIRPRPVQRELPFWLTAAGNRETFRLAGELGANLLTNLMGQTLEDLAGRLAVYRQAWAAAGHPGRGRVTLMMHAFLAADPAVARAQVREPLMRYFRSSVDIFGSFAATQGLQVKVEDLTEQDIRSLVEHGFDRYVESAGLFGSPESCGPMVERLRAMDVDEVACLVDFGTEPQATLDSLAQLAVLRERAGRDTVTLDVRLDEAPGTLVALARERGVTHLGCAPAVARALFGTNGASALSGIGIVTGGLAESLEARGQRLLAAERLERVLAVGLTRAEGAGPDPAVPPPGVERYVVDEAGQLVPVGVAGQLVLGGDAAPAGFWRDARAESARWVAASFADGGKLLATGERARILADGRLERLGRFVPKAAPPKPAVPAALPAPVTAARPRVEAQPIPRAPRDGELPLSYSQQRLWTLDRLS
ncbi:MAG TPA: MupA/Atu3671 family FMN-dependent luciferase-like monooxygenase, partial [Longimicrobium sp.]|nr:MupA/Atu3671 family FMN-dependent luciferase-like monooxygenase [Longimicrobium sp.]